VNLSVKLVRKGRTPTGVLHAERDRVQIDQSNSGPTLGE
jgi:hypothetical protein